MRWDDGSSVAWSRVADGLVVRWDEPTPTRVFLELAWQPMHFGGARPWFVCPSCGRRCGAVALLSNRAECRECGRYSYASSRASGDTMSEAHVRMRAIERRLRQTPRIGRPVPKRPKGMHRRTYWRLVAQWFDEHDRMLGAMREWTNRAVERWGD